MIKNTLIIVLAILLAGTSYLLYQNKNISIVLDSEKEPQAQKSKSFEDFHEQEFRGTTNADVDIKDEIEPIGTQDFDPYLDPIIRVTINEEREIVTDYKIIGPRIFSLVTSNDEPMVEINLETGEVKLNPDYGVDEAAAEFWRSIGKKYPEVCFVE